MRLLTLSAAVILAGLVLAATMPSAAVAAGTIQEKPLDSVTCKNEIPTTSDTALLVPTNVSVRGSAVTITFRANTDVYDLDDSISVWVDGSQRFSLSARLNPGMTHGLKATVYGVPAGRHNLNIRLVKPDFPNEYIGFEVCPSFPGNYDVAGYPD